MAVTKALTTRSTEEMQMADPPPSPPYPGAPRWVKVSGIIAIVLTLLVVVLLLAGGGPHGPGRHMPSGDPGGDPPHKGGHR